MSVISNAVEIICSTHILSLSLSIYICNQLLCLRVYIQIPSTQTNCFLQVISIDSAATFSSVTNTKTSLEVFFSLTLIKSKSLVVFFCYILFDFDAIDKNKANVKFDSIQRLAISCRLQRRLTMTHIAYNVTIHFYYMHVLHCKRLLIKSLNKKKQTNKQFIYFGSFGLNSVHNIDIAFVIARVLTSHHEVAS